MEKTAKILELKKQLSEELRKEASDNNIVLALSNEIAKLDDSLIRFSVDAGIINRLGKELVARQETAVSELVKNAYDADADEVELVFKDAWDEGGTLHIKDNGLGMNREALINGFMRLSSADKIHNPVSPRYKRMRAGKKGIGRFATQRLGSRLTIITQTLEMDTAIKVTIDWDTFETDLDLSAVTSSIESIPKIKEEGTDLIIEDLREGWSDAMIRRVYRYTSDLLQPFPLSQKRKDEEDAKTDPGFKSSYYRHDEDDKPYLIIDEQNAFFGHALAEIEGVVSETGQAHWSLKSDKLNFPKDSFPIGKGKENKNFEYLKDVYFKVYYFIFDTSLLSSHVGSFIREVANEKGGIRIYRNGFRVLPYGEKLNDWLGLDESTARRVFLTPHRNINFFGFVELIDETGELFDETSSREGLIDNEAFKELIEFVQRSIITATIKVSELRQRKGATSQKGWKKDEDVIEEDPGAQVDEAIADLKAIINNTAENKTNGTGQEQTGSNNAHTDRIRSVVERIEENREKEKHENKVKETVLIEEINMLRVLAGLGLVIGEFVHEVKRFLPAFHTDSLYLQDKVKTDPEATARAARLDANIKAFTAYTSYFDKTIAQNISRELEPLELRDIVYAFEEVIKRDIERTNLTFHKPHFSGFDLFTTPMHKSEWASILFNLYTNAKKAIKRAGAAGQIFISCGKNEQHVFLDFSDNGDGIPKQNEHLIFNAFFTTASAAGYTATDTEVMTGTGLGLKIVRDIAESYGGSVYVIQPANGFNTTIRIEIPANIKAKQ